ncbi:stage V sporulation protein AD [Sutcliffiella horikoshii]|uniref:Stage V sporulation protein AD n=1 Tax=Sutcliffiella horikoshii TaxID=79883 RepID=A0ABM6KHF0_9BACI|nr:stage V sporulation protein AD [Sutcliffiella horikoshii]ART75851.1 stage V sporulation protein AD [Sutcliffiella horikoshii]
MLQGKQSWVFANKPVITSSATIGGPFEANGLLANDFDMLHKDLWLEQDSYEKAHRVLLEQACETALNKAGLSLPDVQFLLAGDLINQMTPSNFAAEALEVPYLGVFGACSTSMEGLALASFLVNYGGAKYCLTGASSHNAAVEKQFRYPTEYGGQKPPTAQWTVTGAGVGLVSSGGVGPQVTSATIGKVINMGLSDPFNMGGAMAPAAVDTIEAHFNDTGRDPSYYDLIATGDLGEIGREVSLELLREKGLQITDEQYQDCGLMIYDKSQPVLAGGSGAGCSAVVLYGHLLNEMKKGTYKRILLVATGALLSPVSFQQKESIPCIAHAVSIEMGMGGVS